MQIYKQKKLEQLTPYVSQNLSGMIKIKMYILFVDIKSIWSA